MRLMGCLLNSVLIQLPNRLGKMLAPLHWHDYKRKYGKLDEFVNSHPEVSSLFNTIYIRTYNLNDGGGIVHL